MFVLANMWFQTLMRQFFFNVDKIVFGFISTVYDFLITIARTSILSQADIVDMADRIYKLLAVFMIFKVTFSLIMYVVNPDDFSDNSKGVAKLGTNIIISLALLILTPYIFNYAYQLQTIILEDNSLSALIFGDAQDNVNEAPFESAGDKMAYITMSPFFVPNASIDALYECSQLTVKDANGNSIFNEACSGLDSNFETTGDSDSLMALTIDNDKFTEQTLKNYVAGVNVGNLDLMFRQDIAIATTVPEDGEEADFIIEYKYIFSTVVGVVVILLLIGFCMDVALRSVKLAFLQLIAPIPIISFIDPKSGKDGIFKKWYQMCLNTYISLFIRLLAIYFAAYIISRIDRMVDIVDGSYVSNLLVKIVIIIGVLMFAKQLPKILEGLGIKLDGGSFSFNPLKKIENDMIGGKQISKAAKVPFKYAGRAAKGIGTAGLVGGAALATGQGFRGAGKAFSGAMKGEKFGKNFSNSYGAARERHRQVEEMKANGVEPGEVRRANIYNRFHGMSKQQQQQHINTRMDRVVKSWDDAIATVDAVDVEAKRLKAKVEGIKQAGASQFKDKLDVHGNVVESASDQYQKAIKAAEGELDDRRNSVIADLSKLDDGNGGRAGGEAARAKIHQIIENRNKDIQVINDAKVTYIDEHNQERTIVVNTSAPAKVVSKSMQGEQGAWQISDSYQDTEAIAKYTNVSSKK